MRNKKTIIILNIMLACYSLEGVCSKMAAGAPFLSKRYVFLYLAMLGILAIYAITWQQIIKKMPLTSAYANKAITIVWGMLWGVVFFAEKITVGKIIGAVCVITGVILYFKSDNSNYE